jgi:ABC-type dipeptide/oligopeptide/nickel transport system permease component
MAHTLAVDAARWSAYLGRRMLSAVLAMLGVVVIVFLVTRVLGDPVRLILGPRATPEQYEELRRSLGYDDPLWQQFASYVGGLVQGDLGVSRYTLQPVTTEIFERFPATVELAGAGMLLGLLWTIPLGAMAARRPGGIVDRISQVLVEFGVAIPSFWLGLLLIYLLFYLLGVAPAPVGQLEVGGVPPPRITGLLTVDSLLAGDLSTFRSAIAHLTLPAITLAVTSTPPILQLTRNSMIEVLRSDFVRGARSFGLPERTIHWYAFKNALLPVLTMAAMTFGFLLGGTVLVETVFSWPGVGLYAIQSMQRFDYEPVLGVVLLASAVYVLVYFVADLLAMLVDPRVREGT